MSTRAPLNLLEIAQAERALGPGLFDLLNAQFQRAPITPDGFPDAVIWQMGQFRGEVRPVTHTITDKFSLVGTLMALDVLGVPSYLVPMMAQYRHDLNLAPLDWFGAMPGFGIKWSTAGDMFVSDGSGGTVVVKGKSGNAPLRTKAGVFCNVRTLEIVDGVVITNVRFMPGLPYSQDKKKFSVREDGIVHSEMNTPGDRMAHACKLFLKLVNDRSYKSGSLGRGAIKPTQAQEDGIMAGLLTWMLAKTKFTVIKTYKVNAYEEHREACDRIIALLPPNFCDEMAEWTGEISLHIADTNYGLLLHDFLDKREVVVLSTDLDGDRLTDLMADAPKVFIKLCGLLGEKHGLSGTGTELWQDLGFTALHGFDMPSIMHRKSGLPIYEMTLGTADDMLERWLDGGELGTPEKKKSPYNPRIHFSLTSAAMKAANPRHHALHEFLDRALEAFDGIYGENAPTFLEGYAQLKEAITPWGAEVAA